ncbi:MAG: phosphonate ABC transporter, permease protein PhnE [Anaerolineae bacterium CG_4_9_14_0_8_um_filter_58_9]|nr:MAG: phosphonate ABC transporter, permease protein PhnE [Anaerolineae bacterium CG06_land_8_20_14_3_00_57_67]PJH75759.1 MAG: phosphonate ABC transporter, permease protein PhnE [Anaerolineae bacterium CG_4_9_14_0_8_um_filter_58_9]
MKKENRLLRYVTWLLVGVLLVFSYKLSIDVTQPDFFRLFISLGKAEQMKDLLRPLLFVHETETYMIGTAFPFPCGSAPTPTADTSGPRLQIEPACADEAGATVLVRGLDLGQNADVAIRWRLADDRTLTIKRLTTDANGNIELEIETRAIIQTENGIPPRIEAEASLPNPKIIPSQALTDVTNAIIVTIFMALLATTMGILLAVPFSFLGARNIVHRGWLGSSVYYFARSIFNIVRSFEALVMATIFALIVGFGSPFAGVLAMMVVSFASFGKMFSESIESIDPGPLEAITAVGGDRAQVVFYGVIPQILPDFFSFALYHWDINVRISTVIGFVGGGGIGYYLSQSINSFEYRQASTALLAIIIVVWALDFLSAQIRRRLI